MNVVIPPQESVPFNPEIIVQDNFMPDEFCDNLAYILANPDSTFPWFFGEANYPDSTQTEELTAALTNWQFSHVFYSHPSHNYDTFHLVKPVIDKINPDVLFRVKANINPNTLHQIVHGYHVDETNTGMTSILYLNDNNGMTIFKPDYYQVESKKGRLVTFDNRILHSGTTTTDTRFRLVLNINYYKHSLL